MKAPRELPTLEAEGVHTDLLYALTISAHSHTTDGDQLIKHDVVSDPMSFAVATKNFLASGAEISTCKSKPHAKR